MSSSPIVLAGAAIATLALVSSPSTANRQAAASTPGPRIVELTLTAAPARLALLPGKPTDVLAYNGTVPGPVLEFREGDSVIIHLRNQLPVPTTIHWHGLHIPSTSDGSALDPVAPGATHDYVFRLLPGSAGTYWYHPHPDHETGYQIGMGLYGALIVRDPNDPLAGIPERLLVLSDSRIAEDGSVHFADPASEAGAVDRENGREGERIFVNGTLDPTLTIRRGEVQRWRIVNAAAARVLRLSLGGRPFLHVGNDGGLFERPVERREILVANSERVELLVRGAPAADSTLTLSTLPYDRYIPQTRPRDWNRERPILTLRTSSAPPVRARPIPERLRHVAWIDTTTVSVRRVFALSQGLINGRTMDMARVDEHASLGATEIWEIENLVGMDHPFHLHGFQFQVLDRDGVPEPFPSWKDVVNLPKHSTARIVVRLDDYPGKWMYHCHILDHEDHGMMGVLEVK